ncbi:hypothetical protein G8D99_07885 [Acinetobacter lanii]|uniref:RHS protein conserved region domain-containing protein n=2 Tax=Acinetobacter lanii TaxID=2715163 RepID=A0A6G8S804_9GAMM|nr:hypothetical protein G8D99_07885 [Acinetobacter lanii]
MKPDGCGGQEIIQTQYCYDPFGRRIAKQSQTYKKEIITQQIQAKIQHEKANSQNSKPTVNHQLGSSMNLSLGGSTHSAISTHLNTNRSKIIRPAKTIQTESTQLIQKQAVWNVWDGNRILQDHNGKHVFTTVYEADSFVPLARLVWLDNQLTQAANDESTSKTNIEKLDQLKHIALQNLGELEGLHLSQTHIKQASNDEPPKPKHNQHQLYWYQNDHLGTPRELTSKNGNIEWEAVYQAWGNTVTVEWQEVAQTQELNPIQLNATEQSYLLQPHRFQGQIYDVETGLHYNRFRYYDPDAGRFISHDPIGLAGGDNNFQYAPNPIGWIDILGLSCEKASKIDWGRKGFSKGKLSIHYQKHVIDQKEFGDITQTQYLGKAKEFARASSAEMQTASIGKTFFVKANNVTGEVLVGHIKSGEIRTYYKNDGRSIDPFQDAIDHAVEEQKRLGNCPDVEKCK